MTQAEGRWGYVFYSQSEGVLQIYWELSSVGVSIRFLSEEEWERLCQEQSADWAKANRVLIMQRIADGVKRCHRLKGEIDFDENWIHIWSRRSCADDAK